jgi:hypothetical protein
MRELAWVSKATRADARPGESVNTILDWSPVAAVMLIGVLVSVACVRSVERDRPRSFSTPSTMDEPRLPAPAAEIASKIVSVDVAGGRKRHFACYRSDFLAYLRTLHINAQVELEQAGIQNGLSSGKCGWFWADEPVVIVDTNSCSQMVEIRRPSEHQSFWIDQISVE